MCGRLNVIADPLAQLVSKALGVNFSPGENTNLCPSQDVSTLAILNDNIAQLDCRWGIRPSWAKRDLINAQVESVASKPTFRRAFAESRCVVPCTGWYEWSSTLGRKTKYQFADRDGAPLFMAGIWYGDAVPQLVTLTCAANAQCKPYHHRMPVLVSIDEVGDYLRASTDIAQTIASSALNSGLSISECA